MNTLVVYYTMGGTTKETVELMIEKSGKNKFNVFNIKENTNINISGYDRIYIGSGVYGGNMLMEIAKFVKDNVAELKRMDIIIFIHALGSEDKYQEIAAKVMAPLGAKKYDLFYLGGKSDLTKQNFFIRALMKKLAKTKNLDMKYPNNILQSKVQALLSTI